MAAFSYSDNVVYTLLLQVMGTAEFPRNKMWITTRRADQLRISRDLVWLAFGKSCWFVYLLKVPRQHNPPSEFWEKSNRLVTLKFK
jgi:hypothetical protein